jgi:hypothetical protein
MSFIEHLVAGKSCSPPQLENEAEGEDAKTMNRVIDDTFAANFCESCG